MTTKYLDGAGLRYFRDTYVLTTMQVNALIQTAFAQYKQDVFTVVSALPQTGQQEGIMYLVPSSNDPTKLDGYIWEIVDDTINPPTYGWKQPVQGQAQIDLSNYYTKAETDTLLLGKSNVGHTHSASDITSGLATVATSGSYNDLSNTPTIPTVNDGTLTIKVNDTTAGIFTANQATNEEINITIDDVEYATEAQIDALTSEWSLS